MQPTVNIANVLTWIRIAAIPLVVLVFYTAGPWSRLAAATIFFMAAVTDWLDGYVARRLSQQSPFGAFLDPVADKMMVTTALVLIVQSDPRILIALVAAIIIGREIAVSALREWMAELGARRHVAVSGHGKLKTILQMLGVGFMLYEAPLLGLPLYDVGLALLLVAAGLTLWSMFGYMRAAWPRLTSQGEIS